MAAQVERRPKWLAALLSEKFFVPCSTHNTEKKNERNVFCADCNVAICQHCAGRRHVDHMLLQIRRYVYHDVIRLIDIQKLIDCALVQPYIINSAKVVFLNPRPQTRPAKAAASASACASCQRGLQDGYSYCCVGCKVEAALRKGGSGGGGLAHILSRSVPKQAENCSDPAPAPVRSQAVEIPHAIEHPCEALARSRAFSSSSTRRRLPRCSEHKEQQRRSPHSVFVHHDTISAGSSSSISASSSANHRRPSQQPDSAPLRCPSNHGGKDVTVTNSSLEAAMPFRRPRSPSTTWCRNQQQPTSPPRSMQTRSPPSPPQLLQHRNSPPPLSRKRNSSAPSFKQGRNSPPNLGPLMMTNDSPPSSLNYRRNSPPNLAPLMMMNSPSSDDRSCRYLPPPSLLPQTSASFRLPRLSSLPCLRIRLPPLNLTAKSLSPSPSTVRSSSPPPSFLAHHFLQKSYDAAAAAASVSNAGFFFADDDDDGVHTEDDDEEDEDDNNGDSVSTDDEVFAIPHHSSPDRLNYISFRSISGGDQLDFMSLRKRKRKSSPVRARFS